MMKANQPSSYGHHPQIAAPRNHPRDQHGQTINHRNSPRDMIKNLKYVGLAENIDIQSKDLIKDSKVFNTVKQDHLKMPFELKNREIPQVFNGPQATQNNGSLKQQIIQGQKREFYKLKKISGQNLGQDQVPYSQQQIQFTQADYNRNNSNFQVPPIKHQQYQNINNNTHRQYQKNLYIINQQDKHRDYIKEMDQEQDSKNKDLPKSPNFQQESSQYSKTGVYFNKQSTNEVVMARTPNQGISPLNNVEYNSAHYTQQSAKNDDEDYKSYQDTFDMHNKGASEYKEDLMVNTVRNSDIFSKEETARKSQNRSVPPQLKHSDKVPGQTTQLPQSALYGGHKNTAVPQPNYYEIPLKEAYRTQRNSLPQSYAQDYVVDGLKPDQAINNKDSIKVNIKLNNHTIRVHNHTHRETIMNQIQQNTNNTFGLPSVVSPSIETTSQNGSTKMVNQTQQTGGGGKPSSRQKYAKSQLKTMYGTMYDSNRASKGMRQKDKELLENNANMQNLKQKTANILQYQKQWQIQMENGDQLQSLQAQQMAQNNGSKSQQPQRQAIVDKQMQIFNEQKKSIYQKVQKHQNLKEGQQTAQGKKELLSQLQNKKISIVHKQISPGQNHLSNNGGFNYAGHKQTQPNNHLLNADLSVTNKKYPSPSNKKQKQSNHYAFKNYIKVREEQKQLQSLDRQNQQRVSTKLNVTNTQHSAMDDINEKSEKQDHDTQERKKEDGEQSNSLLKQGQQMHSMSFTFKNKDGKPQNPGENQDQQQNGSKKGKKQKGHSTSRNQKNGSQNMSRFQTQMINQSSSKQIMNQTFNNFNSPSLQKIILPSGHKDLANNKNLMNQTQYNVKFGKLDVPNAATNNEGNDKNAGISMATPSVLNQTPMITQQGFNKNRDLLSHFDMGPRVPQISNNQTQQEFYNSQLYDQNSNMMLTNSGRQAYNPKKDQNNHFLDFVHKMKKQNNSKKAGNSVRIQQIKMKATSPQPSNYQCFGSTIQAQQQQLGFIEEITNMKIQEQGFRDEFNQSSKKKIKKRSQSKDKGGHKHQYLKSVSPQPISSSQMRSSYKLQQQQQQQHNTQNSTQLAIQGQSGYISKFRLIQENKKQSVKKRIMVQQQTFQQTQGQFLETPRGFQINKNLNNNSNTSLTSSQKQFYQLQHQQAQLEQQQSAKHHHQLRLESNKNNSLEDRSDLHKDTQSNLNHLSSQGNIIPQNPLETQQHLEFLQMYNNGTSKDRNEYMELETSFPTDDGKKRSNPIIIGIDDTMEDQEDELQNATPKNDNLSTLDDRNQIESLQMQIQKENLTMDLIGNDNSYLQQIPDPTSQKENSLIKSQQDPQKTFHMRSKSQFVKSSAISTKNQSLTSNRHHLSRKYQNKSPIGSNKKSSMPQSVTQQQQTSPKNNGNMVSNQFTGITQSQFPGGPNNSALMEDHLSTQQHESQMKTLQKLKYHYVDHQKGGGSLNSTPLRMRANKDQKQPFSDLLQAKKITQKEIMNKFGIHSGQNQDNQYYQRIQVNLNNDSDLQKYEEILRKQGRLDVEQIKGLSNKYKHKIGMFQPISTQLNLLINKLKQYEVHNHNASQESNFTIQQSQLLNQNGSTQMRNEIDDKTNRTQIYLLNSYQQTPQGNVQVLPDISKDHMAQLQANAASDQKPKKQVLKPIFSQTAQQLNILNKNSKEQSQANIVNSPSKKVSTLLNSAQNEKSMEKQAEIPMSATNKVGNSTVSGGAGEISTH